ncbi:MAG: 2-amino-4-hydroxy-6-hydroxymethyldihydropteridine diphosphokinase [Gammaproteobacteria bacterium]|nr:2-amino-4-hydroxy-6-hydroxymethyldihydropteridine diphosphokinase [Gammaproteobacteria bacterium]
MSTRCYVALGSNLQQPNLQLDFAIKAMSGLDATRLISQSSYYRSRPMGPQDQPDYLNAVAELETGLEAEALLDRLQAIEMEQGRERTRHWGPRTLDLDILLFGDEVIDSERLKVPHPGLFQRNFVLYPLHEIRPGLIFPDGQSLAELIENCPADGLARMESE